MKKCSAQVCIEYAFSLVIFFFFIIGIIQLIFVVRNYLILGNLVEEVARSISISSEDGLAEKLIEEGEKRLLHTPLLNGEVHYTIDSQPIIGGAHLKEEVKVDIFYKLGIRLGAKLTLPIWETSFSASSYSPKEVNE